MREPENRALVLFEREVDMEVWFRDDAIAADLALDAHTLKRWFKVGDYDIGPLSWDAVLQSDPDITPVLLVRAS